MTAQTPSAIHHPKHRAPARATAKPLRSMVVALVIGAVAFVAVGPASASATGQTQAPQGWARVAHLSPDTRSVDVELAAVAGGQVLFDLKDVGYGDVSEYLRLPAGTYMAGMTPTGSAEVTAPALSQLITVKEGQPVTLAVLGANDDLTAKVVSDDLTPPADGQARVRVIQASTVAESVDIKMVSGMTIAAGAKGGEVTGYATVEDGPWDLQLFTQAQTSEVSIDLASGSTHTLLVLDNAAGGLTIKAIPDSASVTDVPVGGTNTGAGPAGTGPLESASTGPNTTGDGPVASGAAVLLVVTGTAAILMAAQNVPRRLLPVPNRRRR